MKLLLIVLVVFIASQHVKGRPIRSFRDEDDEALRNEMIKRFLSDAFFHNNQEDDSLIEKAAVVKTTTTEKTPAPLTKKTTKATKTTTKATPTTKATTKATTKTTKATRTTKTTKATTTKATPIKKTTKATTKATVKPTKVSTTKTSLVPTVEIGSGFSHWISLLIQKLGECFNHKNGMENHNGGNMGGNYGGGNMMGGNHKRPVHFGGEVHWNIME